MQPARRTPASRSARGAAARDGSRRRTIGDRRRREILDAAVEVFNRRGYSAAGLQEIAGSVGMKKASLYYYIRSKDDLLYWIVQETHENLLENVEACEQLGDDVLAKLRQFIDGHVRRSAADVGKARIFYADFSFLEPQRRQEIVSERRQYEQYLADLIQTASDRGLVRSNVDPKVASIGILTMLNALYVWYRPNAWPTIDHVAAQYTDLLVGGLLEPGAGSGS